MTTNQTIDGVPRALLERSLKHLEWFGLTSEKEVKELRALLDAESCGACNGCTNGCRLDAESPPSQSQGEPVVLIELVENKTYGGMHIAKWDNPGRLKEGFHRLYAEQPAPVAVVPELTSELRWILGQMCFQHIHTAQALRLMGHEIAKKAEDEQAVTIYWMLGHYLKDPTNWRQNASKEIKAAYPAA